jgi:hypothetical protein
VAPVQSTQACPFAPHRLADVPETQAEGAVNCEQQPPLHVSPPPGPQAVVEHTCVNAWQLEPVGQSEALLQPQA